MFYMQNINFYEFFTIFNELMKQKRIKNNTNRERTGFF
jgi:hypothetical protein